MADQPDNDGEEDRVARWSLGNWVRPLSYKQFKLLAAEFKKAADTAFGTDSKIEFRAMDQVPHRITSFEQHVSDEQKVSFATESADDLSSDVWEDLTEEVWAQASYIEMIAKPLDVRRAASYAFGHAEFKGARPKQATFYLQGDHAESAGQQVMDQHVLMRQGAGYDGNSTLSYA